MYRFNFPYQDCDFRPISRFSFCDLRLALNAIDSGTSRSLDNVGDFRSPFLYIPPTFLLVSLSSISLRLSPRTPWQPPSEVSITVASPSSLPHYCRFVDVIYTMITGEQVKRKRKKKSFFLVFFQFFQFFFFCVLIVTSLGDIVVDLYTDNAL